MLPPVKMWSIYVFSQGSRVVFYHPHGTFQHNRVEQVCSNVYKQASHVSNISYCKTSYLEEYSDEWMNKQRGVNMYTNIWKEDSFTLHNMAINRA